jgi:uncharacterized protein YceH (UPF0502 family)
MANRDRRGSQLAVLLDPQLLERLRAYSAATGRPIAHLVRGWIEQGLAAALEGSAGPASTADLTARVEALERSVAALQGCDGPPEVVRL